MVNVLKKEYWSRADAFLLPLVGLPRDSKYEVHSYLFWDEYSIQNYHLILTYETKDKDDVVEYCRKTVFPILDKGGYLLENYDSDDKVIFVLDVSVWAMDIEMLMMGKYSKLSKEAKGLIENYHKFNVRNIPVHVYAVLYPNKKMAVLENLTPIEYISSAYDIPIEELLAIGEIGSIYNVASETLSAKILPV